MRTTFHFISCTTCKFTQPLDWYLHPNRRNYCIAGHLMAQRFVTGRVTTKECNGACLNAKGPDCECSCGGENHGRYAA